jgi:hypothetical protein
MNIETTLTFNGVVPLIPDILIDSFEKLQEGPNTNKIKYCFISHAHSDHYNGLSKQLKQIPLPKFILTKTTRDLILLRSNISKNVKRNLYNCIFPIFNKTFEIEPGLLCTFIPNFHCLGSAMILLSNSRNKEFKTILYSGDARFEPCVNYAIRTSSALSPFIFGNRQLDMLYLDTTFAYRKKNIEILENLNGIYQLIEFIELYPPKTHFKFLDTTYGFEEVWVKIFNKFSKNCGISMNENISKWVEHLRFKIEKNEIDELENNVNIIDKIDELSNIDLKDYKYYFHFGNSAINTKYPIIEIKHAIDLSFQEYKTIYLPKKKKEFYELIEEDHENNIWIGKFWFNNGEYNKHLLKNKYITDNFSELFLPMHIKFIYSRHSSYSETKQFVDIFKYKPKDIYPLTESFDTWQRGFNMENFYEISNTSYDKISLKNYGSCNHNIKDNSNNIQITNFWNSITNSIHSFNSISTDIDFDFNAIGQDLRRNGNPESFDERKRNLLDFKTKVIGTQINEKRKRLDRWLQNLDTSSSLNDENTQATIETIEISSDFRIGDVGGINYRNGKKKRKVMQMNDNLKTLLTDVSFT